MKIREEKNLSVLGGLRFTCQPCLDRLFCPGIWDMTIFMFFSLLRNIRARLYEYVFSVVCKYNLIIIICYWLIFLHNFLLLEKVSNRNSKKDPEPIRSIKGSGTYWIQMCFLLDRTKESVYYRIRQKKCRSKKASLPHNPITECL